MLTARDVRKEYVTPRGPVPGHAGLAAAPPVLATSRSGKAIGCRQVRGRDAGGVFDLDAAIHHHGDMLLSTVTAFGPGYEHWTFKKPEVIDSGSESYSISLIEHAPHPLHHVAFVDSYVAHLPFYPGSMTITYALWSSKFPATWKDRLKRVPLLQRNSARLKRVAARAGMAKHLELKVVEYFDFYPTAEGFCGIRERKEFERGPNADYLPSLFQVIQETGNEQLAPLLKEQLNAGMLLENPDLLRDLIHRLESGQTIEGRLSATHYGIERANFTRHDLELALAAQKSGLPTEFLTEARQVITPGATIIFTDKPVDPTTQSHTGFQIVVAQKDKPSGTAE